MPVSSILVVLIAKPSRQFSWRKQGMCIHPTPSARTTQQQSANACPAKLLAPKERQGIAVQALAGKQSITRLAQDHEVSRKFVYQQAQKAEQALDEAFPSAAANDEEVLFYLPVTKGWLRAFVVALLLICRSSYRGVQELLRDLFGFKISPAQVHTVARTAMARARPFNEKADLSKVGIGAHDEIFQKGVPVLAGVDVTSTYCYLLSVEEQRDAETWAIRLLELQDRGFDPEAIICDGGAGLQAGQALALPETPRRGDVFHALQETEQLVVFLENRAYDAIALCSKLDRKQVGEQKKRGRNDASASQKLRHARPAEAQALALADDVATLMRWLRRDVLAVAGPPFAERCALYDFIVAELRTRQELCPHRLAPVCTYLTNHRDALLAFAKELDSALDALAEEFQLPVALLRELLHVQMLDLCDQRRWPREALLRQQLRGRFYEVSDAVASLAASTVRASSMIENFNSRLRTYFFLRRHLGPDYLHLLQFFLNHRRFLRSEHPQRVGKSPAELLTGQAHPHWLDLLGFTWPRLN
jgi:hypothetical protein